MVPVQAFEKAMTGIGTQPFHLLFAHPSGRMAFGGKKAAAVLPLGAHESRRLLAIDVVAVYSYFCLGLSVLTLFYYCLAW